MIGGSLDQICVAESEWPCFERNTVALNYICLRLFTRFLCIVNFLYPPLMPIKVDALEGLDEYHALMPKTLYSSRRFRYHRLPDLACWLTWANLCLNMLQGIEKDLATDTINPTCLATLADTQSVDVSDMCVQ